MFGQQPRYKLTYLNAPDADSSIPASAWIYEALVKPVKDETKTPAELKQALIALPDASRRELLNRECLIEKETYEKGRQFVKDTCFGCHAVTPLLAWCTRSFEALGIADLISMGADINKQLSFEAVSRSTEFATKLSQDSRTKRVLPTHTFTILHICLLGFESGRYSKIKLFNYSQSPLGDMPGLKLLLSNGAVVEPLHLSMCANNWEIQCYLRHVYFSTLSKHAVCHQSEADPSLSAALKHMTSDFIARHNQLTSYTAAWSAIWEHIPSSQRQAYVDAALQTSLRFEAYVVIHKTLSEKVTAEAAKLKAFRSNAQLKVVNELLADVDHLVTFSGRKSQSHHELVGTEQKQAKDQQVLEYRLSRIKLDRALTQQKMKECENEQKQKLAQLHGMTKEISSAIEQANSALNQALELPMRDVSCMQAHAVCCLLMGRDLDETPFSERNLDGKSFLKLVDYDLVEILQLELVGLRHRLLYCFRQAAYKAAPALFKVDFEAGTVELKEWLLRQDGVDPTHAERIFKAKIDIITAHDIQDIELAAAGIPFEARKPLTALIQSAGNSVHGHPPTQVVAAAAASKEDMSVVRAAVLKRNPELQARMGIIVPTEPIPEELMCPITLVLMEDPVMADDEHTYERAAISTWLQMEGTSPLTRERMSDSLKTNRMALSMIRRFKEKNPGLSAS
eukprot:m.250961 g.250961  ORF g.250961 m.250961 type:complete len:681 (+) comp17516_c1_seq68:277-2319(+)